MMFPEKHQIILRDSYFPGNSWFNYEPALVLFVEAMKNYLPEHTWYGVGVEAFGKEETSINALEGRTHLIGDDQDFIRYCNSVNGFIWGDFLCIDNTFLPKNPDQLERITEDTIAGDGILLKIQIFQVSFFTVYSKNDEIQTIISKSLNAKGLTITEKKGVEIGKLISDLGLNLKEAEFVFYDFLLDTKKLNITLTFQEKRKKMVLSFSDVAKVMCSSIKPLSEITFGKKDDEFLKRALSELDENDRSFANDYQLFCFLDTEETPFFKIVARSYELRVK